MKIEALNTSESKRDRLKELSLFQLIREIFAGRRQTRQIKAADLALKKNLTLLKGVTDFTLALRYLDEAEEILNKAKVLVNQRRERSKRIFGEINSQKQKEEIMVESQIEDNLEYISGLKVLIKILLEGKSSQGVLEKIDNLFNWLGFDSPQIKLSVTEEIIDQEKWKVITIESTECRPSDDMPANIRRRHLGLKEMFERIGGRFYYQAVPSEGTKIILMVSHVVLKKSYA